MIKQKGNWLNKRLAPSPPLEKENLVFKRETQTRPVDSLAADISTASIAFLKERKAVKESHQDEESQSSDKIKDGKPKRSVENAINTRVIRVYVCV